VTFKKVDPFYVVDVAAPSSLAILGELELPGYSSFLQPIGNDLIFGIGKDAKGGDDSFAWYQGVKVGLFNVASPMEPSLVDEFVLGKRGSSSAAELDHKAITIIPSVEGNQWRVALPVSINAEPNAGNSWTRDPDAQHYNWSFDALFLFDITGNEHAQGASLIRNDFLETARSDNTLRRSSFYGINGSVLKGDSVHYFYGGTLWSADWSFPEITNVVDEGS